MCESAAPAHLIDGDDLLSKPVGAMLHLIEMTEATI